MTPEIGDSNYPFSGGSGGSTTAPAVSPAIRVTAGMALDALKARVAPSLGVDPATLVASSGRIHVKDDPSKGLEKITAPVTWINSADDFINPPELGIAERAAKRLKNGRFILIPASEKTRGHGTHTAAALWKDELAALLARSQK